MKMKINDILQQEGWELVTRTRWIAVQDNRPTIKKISSKGRIGKIIGSHLYITVDELRQPTKDFIQEAGAEPCSIKSTNGSSDRVYIGFDTADISDELLSAFAKKLHALAGALSVR